jgi:hypothetical protein
MRQKQTVTKQLALNYQRASKLKRGEVLDWLVELTGYNRSYAAKVLRQRAKPKVLGRLMDGGVATTLVEDERTKRRKPRNRPRKYDKEVLAALEKVWLICEIGDTVKSGTPYLFLLASFLSPRVLFLPNPIHSFFQAVLQISRFPKVFRFVGHSSSISFSLIPE